MPIVGIQTNRQHHLEVSKVPYPSQARVITPERFIRQRLVVNKDFVKSKGAHGDLIHQLTSLSATIF